MAMEQKFKAGSIVCTSKLNAQMLENQIFRMFVHECLVRHLGGDWGDLCKEDKQANERALMDESRLFSAYESDCLPKIWIITESDRSSTCILFPSEY